MIKVTVLGTPIPQGSKTIQRAGTKAWLTDANVNKLKPWRKAITAAVQEQLGDWNLTADPVCVRLTFLMPRPSTVTRSHHTVKPDLDKLIRSALDGITDAADPTSGTGVWVDDSQVVRITAEKEYSNDTPPQLIIRIWNELELD